MPTLDELRKQIDQIDESIISSLNNRAEVVLQVREAKQRDKMDIYSPERERKIVERVAELAEKGKFPKSSVERIFREIVSATRSLVGELSVCYTGEERSPAHTAALKQFGNEVKFHSKNSVAEIFRSVEEGESHFGIIPMEFGSGGFVTSTISAFIDSPLQIVAEINEGREELRTRFVIVGAKSPEASGHDKTTLLCGVWDRAGALWEVLGPFQRRSLSLTKIESKPMMERSLACVFIIDVLGHQKENGLQDTVAELKPLCSYVKILGSYPASSV